MITAALAWFDEEPAALDRCVRSLAGVADALVVLDGPWVGFEHVSTCSPDEQWDAIERAAATVGIRARVEGRSSVWPSQPVKRAALMQHAAVAGIWTLVVDADEFVEVRDPDALRASLTATDLDVAEVLVRQVGSRLRSPGTRPVRRLFRAAAGVTVERAHNGYRAADGRWLSGDPGHVDREPALDATGLVTIVNDLDARPQARANRAAAYYKLRARRREEWAAA